ncbi:MAG: hypothetical protein V5B33_18830 [Candidatus Accumulibacter sp. UW20]|jgi:hypothetical protein
MFRFPPARASRFRLAEAGALLFLGAPAHACTPCRPLVVWQILHDGFWQQLALLAPPILLLLALALAVHGEPGEPHD